MKIGSVSLFGRLCRGLSMAVLTLAVSFDGSRSLRAEDADDLTSSLQEMIVDPIMKTVQGLEARVAGLEATVGAMSESFSSRRVVAQVLCVSDETGSQTCITKAQLDILLTGIARAETSQPPAGATEAKSAPTEGPVETIVTKDTGQYSEQAAAVDERSVAKLEPEHTGSIQSASPGAAIVLNPGIEVTEDQALFKAAPAEAVPPEPVAQSDD